MVNIVISFLTFVLILTSLFLVLVILMQRANSNAGMGSAFGGGVTESAFGAETTNILTRATKWSAVVFFVLSLVLYLLYMGREGRLAEPVDADLPDIPVIEDVAEPLPADVVPAPAGNEPVVSEPTGAIPEEAELPPVEEPTPPAP